MHVCLVTSGRPSEVFFGGEQKFTVSFRSWLNSRGYEVTVVGRKLHGVDVITSEESDRLSIETTLPATLQLPYLVYVAAMLITSLFFVLKIIAVNRRSRISIIHAQDTGYGGLSALISARVLRVPVVISSHGIRYFSLSKIVTGLFSKLSLMFEYWLDNVTVRNADSVIVVASSQADFFLKMGVEKAKINVIPIGIDVEDFQACSSERQTVRKELNAKEEILMGFVGRFSPEKNLRTLLEAFAAASRHADRMKLILVGTGPEEEKLRMLSSDWGIDKKIVFTGIRFDINRLLSALDIFVLPSFTEGCPTSMLEAMAAGKAIIASNIPSICEIIRHDKEAILVKPDSVEELTQAILLLYENLDMRAKLGHSAREKAIIYDEDRIYGRILDIFQEFVSRRALPCARA